MYNLIIKYINKITKNDINNFALKNNIYLNNNELIYIYDLIKNHYDDLINNDEKILNESRSYLSNDNYLKIEKIFYDYKKRYKDYL